MKKVEILEKFALELEKGSAKVRTFKEICRSIGERSYKVDRCLRSALGIGGELLTESYRLDVPVMFLIQGCASQPR